MELKLRNYFLLTSYHLPAFCSSADTSCGEGSWSLSRFKLSRLIFNSSRLIRFDKSCCSSSMDFLAGLMRDSATECLRSTISLFSLSNEEYKLRALHSWPSFSTTHSMAALPLLLLLETVLTMMPPCSWSAARRAPSRSSPAAAASCPSPPGPPRTSSSPPC